MITGPTTVTSAFYILLHFSAVFRPDNYFKKLQNTSLSDQFCAPKVDKHLPRQTARNHRNVFTIMQDQIEGDALISKVVFALATY